MSRCRGNALEIPRASSQSCRGWLERRARGRGERRGKASRTSRVLLALDLVVHECGDKTRDIEGRLLERVERDGGDGGPRRRRSGRGRRGSGGRRRGLGRGRRHPAHSSSERLAEVLCGSVRGGKGSKDVGVRDDNLQVGSRPWATTRSLCPAGRAAGSAVIWQCPQLYLCTSLRAPVAAVAPVTATGPGLGALARVARPLAPPPSTPFSLP